MYSNNIENISSNMSTKSVTVTSLRQTNLLQFFPSKRSGDQTVQRKMMMETMKMNNCVPSSSSNYYCDEDSRDSGIGNDSILFESSMSSSDDNINNPSNFECLFNSTNMNGPTSLLSVLNKPFSDIPNENLNDQENNSIKDFNSDTVLRKRTPLKDITNIKRQHHASPISRKTSFRQINERKRSLISIDYDIGCKRIKRIVDENTTVCKFTKFHRTFSTSQIETSSSITSYDFESYDECSYSLSVIDKKQSRDLAFGRIGNEQLVDLLNDEEFNEKYLLIDCRYPYEYNGGHIKGAINVYDPKALLEIFYPKDETEFQKISKKKPIFYCEFSSVRGPNMANKLRKLDRHKNINRYPIVDYKEIYVLEKGYHNFYTNETLRKYCYPQEYIKMKCKQYTKELRQYNFHKKTSCQGFSIRTQSMRHLISKSVTSSPNSSSIIYSEETLDNDFLSKCLLHSPPRTLDSSVIPKSLNLDESPLMN